MTHEIRTPMNAVLGLSRMTLKDDLPPPAREKLTKVYEAAQALTSILDDVLDYSKVEVGALRFELQPFVLADVLRGVKSLFSASVQEKHLALSVDLPLGVQQHLIGDAYRLAQVLNNLVGNAVKFTHEGEVRISVAPTDDDALPPGRHRLRFSVRDTGVGVASEARPTLFHAFTQGDTSVTRRFGGTGLGLAICQRPVEMMHGRFGVNSEPGRGSEFWFTAEFDEAAADGGPASTFSAQPPSAEHDPQAPRPALKLLVAEAADHPEGHFDLVLMDLHMPGTDGLEATRQIHALPQGARLTILALTAAAPPEDRQRCLDAGMNGHLSKPLEPDRLDEVLRQLEIQRAALQPRRRDAAAAHAGRPSDRGAVRQHQCGAGGAGPAPVLKQHGGCGTLQPIRCAARAWAPHGLPPRPGSGQMREARCREGSGLVAHRVSWTLRAGRLSVTFHWPLAPATCTSMRWMRL
ncbi:MAG: response regulator [Rubrivivax sp.]|nr:response regulator [Rubrivivax sp.]